LNIERAVKRQAIL